jgi:hypothetical protein
MYDLFDNHSNPLSTFDHRKILEREVYENDKNGSKTLIHNYLGFNLIKPHDSYHFS